MGSGTSHLAADGLFDSSATLADGPVGYSWDVGIGKTHTAKLAIRKARRAFGFFNSVLTESHSGVAAANIGDGARTEWTASSSPTQTLRQKI